MTAMINPPANSTSAFDLLCKVDVTEFVTAAAIIKGEEGVIICSGKNVRIWLKRESGQYWPSVCKTMTANCACMDYNNETQRLFIGLENGVITEYSVSDDYNKLLHQKDHFSHSAGLVSCLFSLPCEWLISIGKDKLFVWHCSETGRRLGSFDVGDFCSSLQFDSPAKYAFIGDFSGNVSILRIKDNSYELITRLSAHTGCVRCLVWDSERQLLFSGSFDKLIICWDIGSKKGTAVELYGHKSRVASLILAEGSKKLFSADESGFLLCWNTIAQRKETPQWASSNICQQCDTPFFWNVRDMWSKKVVGLRQHHCRICGKAVCDKCSQHSLKYPPMGYELEIRMCDKCYHEMEDKTFESLAVMHQTKHNIVCICLDEANGRLITVGTDKIMKIWDVKKALQ